MVLRLEDTDQTRLVPGAAAALDAMLQWAGIEMNEGPNAGGKHGPYTQSERLPLYRGHADALVASGSAYPCFCTAERLAAVRQLGARTNRLTAYVKPLCGNSTHFSIIWGFKHFFLLRPTYPFHVFFPRFLFPPPPSFFFPFQPCLSHSRFYN